VSAAQRSFIEEHGLPEAQFFADAFVESGSPAPSDVQPLPVQS
jgi:hypothetical protein